MIIKPILYAILFIYVISGLKAGSQNIDYYSYHKHVITIENLIADERFPEALKACETLYNDYEFVFSRDYKIAAQLATLLSENEKAFTLIRKGISAG